MIPIWNYMYPELTNDKNKNVCKKKEEMLINKKDAAATGV